MKVTTSDRLGVPQSDKEQRRATESAGEQRKVMESKGKQQRAMESTREERRAVASDQNPFDFLPPRRRGFLVAGTRPFFFGSTGSVHR